MNKSKIINIILLILGILTLCICMFVIVSSQSKSVSDTIIVKDMSDENGREIGDKDNISGFENSEYTLKGELPNNYLDPNDLFNNSNTNTDKEPIVEVIKTNKDSIFVGNPNNGELFFGDGVLPGEKPEKEEKIGEPVSKISFNYVLRCLKGLLQDYEDKIFISGDLFKNYILNTTLNNICKDNGAIIVPVQFNNEKQINNLKMWINYSKVYKDIPIIFFYTEFDYNLNDVLNKLEENGIDKELNFYENNSNELLYQFNMSNLSYCAVNIDGMVVQYEDIKNELDVSSIVSNILSSNTDYSEKVDKVTEWYENDLITSYKDLKDLFVKEYYGTDEG